MFANKDSVEALIPDAEKALGQVDILVANAGITKDNLFVALKDEDWEQVLNVNLTSTFRLARAAIKLVQQRFEIVHAAIPRPRRTKSGFSRGPYSYG